MTRVLLSLVAGVACFSIDESLTLTPSGGVTLDGLILQRSATTGRYTNDAGIDFDVNQAKVAVVPIPSVCNTTAETLTLTVADPFEPPDAGNVVFSVNKS